MAHNFKKSYNYFYVEEDLTYFRTANANPLLEIFEHHLGLDLNLIISVNLTMMSLVRMPFSDNWRVKGASIYHDGLNCTLPLISSNYIKLN